MNTLEAALVFGGDRSLYSLAFSSNSLLCSFSFSLFLNVCLTTHMGSSFSNQGLNSGFPAVEAESYHWTQGSPSPVQLWEQLWEIWMAKRERYFTVISQGWARFYAPTEFLYPHPISWMIFLTELSSINELSLLQTWLCSGHVKGTLKDMVWTVESRISHEVNQVQLLAQESLPEEISSKCLELGAWGLGDLVLRHGRDLPQRWSWRFIFSCKI